MRKIFTLDFLQGQIMLRGSIGFNMNLKLKEHDLTVIADFDNKILMYAEMHNLEKGLCSSRAQKIFISLVRYNYLFIHYKNIL